MPLREVSAELGVVLPGGYVGVVARFFVGKAAEQILWHFLPPERFLAEEDPAGGDPVVLFPEA